MKNVILACEIIKDEVNKALNESGNNDHVIWVEASLHLYPEKLNIKLQEEIDKLDAQDDSVGNILFSFGYCGNALLGLKSLKSNLIIPRVNDCIEMFLSDSNEKESFRSKGCYFLTRGWLSSKGNVSDEYDYYIKKYGEARGKRIMGVMLAHYHFLELIDTGAYPLEEYVPIADEISKKLNLELSVIKGSIRLLKKLFTGPWDSEFCVIPPLTTVTTEDFGPIELTASQGQAKKSV